MWSTNSYEVTLLSFFKVSYLRLHHYTVFDIYCTTEIAQVYCISLAIPSLL